MAGDSLVRSHYPRYTPASVLYLLNGRRTVVERRGVLWYTVVQPGECLPATPHSLTYLLAGPGQAGPATQLKVSVSAGWRKLDGRKTTVFLEFR